MSSERQNVEQHKTPLVEFIKVSRRFGHFWAVRDVTLRVYPGEVVGLLGPNGAGKTTSLRIMTGLLSPTHGTIKIQGYPVLPGEIEFKRYFTFIPEDSALYPRMTPRELLSFVWVIHFRTVPDQKKIESVLEEVDLLEYADWLIEEFSHGMRQRLLLSIALLKSTPLWIIDEPVIGLDPLAIRKLKTWFQAHTRAGGAILLSTHLLGFAEEVCDRVAVMNRGRIIDTGTVEELRTKILRGHGDLEEIFIMLIENERQNLVSSPH